MGFIPETDDSGGDYGLPPFLPLTAALRRRSKAPGFELGDDSVLPNARAAAASVPTNPVEQARVLPSATAARNTLGGLAAGYDTKLDDYQKQLQELNKDPDYTALGRQQRARGMEGVQALGASIAAGMGPQDMRGLQSHFAQQSAQMLAPQKIEGGEIDSSGEVRLDPGYKRQKQIADLRASMEHLEKQKLAAVTAEEKYRIEQQQQRMLNAFHEAQLQASRDAAADRAANARALIDLRRDAIDAKNGPLGVKDAAQIEDRMGDDFRAQTKNYVTELDAARKILTVPTDRKWTPIEQQSAIVMLNKILDPGSVVREGEFNRVAEAQGVFQRAGLALERLKSGATLSPALVTDIRNVADFYNKASQQRMDAIAQDYSDRAHRRGLDPRNVVGIYAPKAPAAAGATPNAGANERADSYMPNAKP
jgi:hypothetical protein